MTSALNLIVKYGLYLIIILAPTQYSFSIKGAYVSIVDPLIWIICGIWFLSTILKSKVSFYKEIKIPLGNILFPILIAISFFKTPDYFSSARELFQIVEYVIIGFIIFSRGLQNGKEIKTSLYCLAGTFTLVVIYGTLQYFNSSIDFMKVSSTFGNRNVYGGYLAISLPFILGWILFEKKWSVKIWLSISGILAMITLLAGGATLAILISCSIVCAVKSMRAIMIWMLFVLILFSFILHSLPRNNIEKLTQSIQLYNQNAEVEPRYTEWQASVQMWQEEPLFGIGTGAYQEVIGEYFGFLTVPEGPKEPDHNNLYLVIASSTGAFGIIGLLTMLFCWFSKASNAYLVSKSDMEKSLTLGTIGSLVAFFIANFWTALIVRGVFMPFIIIVALTFAIDKIRNKQQKKEKNIKNSGIC